MSSPTYPSVTSDSRAQPSSSEIQAAGSVHADQILKQLPKPGSDWPIGIHYVEIPTLEEARDLLGPSSDELRIRRSRKFFEALPNRARTRLRLGMHDRGEEYLFADGKIHPEDLAGHNRHLPLHLKVVRFPEFRISRNQTLDVSSSFSVWPGLHHREELYVYVHYNRLVVEPGARLEVHGNVMVLVCDEILLADQTDVVSQPALEIRILGTRHAAFGQARRYPARNGEAGQAGVPGENHSGGKTLPTAFGPMWSGPKENLAGEDGRPGGDGQPGTHGQNGGMSMLADIRVGSLVGFPKRSLRIFGQASPGWPGGRGGDGGNGGQGGDGADGIDAIQGLVPGGLGGSGGNGGRGGDGGRGGNGGLASNIFVQIPSSLEDRLDLCSLSSCGGSGGLGGSGGRGGQAGSNGALAPSTSHPSNGQQGKDGHDGAPGRSRAGPQIWVFPESTNTSEEQRSQNSTKD